VANPEYAEASQYITTLVQQGNDQAACADLATALKDEVVDSIASAQKELDSQDDGSECVLEGQQQVTDAENAKSVADKVASAAAEAAASAAKAPVDLGEYTLDALESAECKFFESDEAYIAAKKAKDKAATAKSDAASEALAAAAAVKTAQGAASVAVVTCQCRVKTQSEKMWKAANQNTESAAGWSKAAHMTCVLEGTAPSDCKVPDMPKVQPASLADGVAEAPCGLLGGSMISGVIGAKNGVAEKTYWFYPTTTEAKSGSYTQIMKDECAKIGMKPLCDHPSYCKNDQDTVYIGQTYHIAHTPHRTHMSYFGAGWKDINDQFPKKFCTFTGKNGNDAKSLCTTGGGHAWNTPAQNNVIMCASTTNPLSKLAPQEQPAKEPEEEPEKVKAGTPFSLAGKGVAQSSTGYNGPATRAIDGNTNSNYGQGSCTHTTKTNKPWWRVDLAATQQVGAVQVWNRGDCCGSRLNGFQVRVGDSSVVNSNPQCGADVSISEGKSVKVACESMQGRYVGITLPRSDYLTICEVKVFH